jgi:hypothetical protein
MQNIYKWSYKMGERKSFDIKRRSLSEFTWVSAAQYIQWLELNCGLTEVNITDIWSMRVKGRSGFKGLRSQKIKIEAALLENKGRLEAFELENEVESKQSDIICAFVGNIEGALAAISGQIDTLTHLVDLEWERLELEYEDFPLDVSEEEPPF